MVALQMFAVFILIFLFGGSAKIIELKATRPKSRSELVVLIWTIPDSGFWKQYFQPPVLKFKSCDLPVVYTIDRQHHKTADAVLFILPSKVFLECSSGDINGDIVCEELPKKIPGQLFVTVSIENRRNHPQLEHSFLRKQGIDIIADHKLDSDMPITLLTKYYLPDGSIIPDSFFHAPRVPTLYADYARMGRIPTKHRLAKAIAVYSNCVDKANWRHNFVMKLKKYFPVDVYGKCADEGSRDQANISHILSRGPYYASRWQVADEKASMLEQYSFALVMENVRDKDYVTEKLWQALLVGTTPIYVGATNIQDFLPCKNKECIVDANDFSGVIELSTHLNELIDNPELYSLKHRWRQETKPYERWLSEDSLFMKVALNSVDNMHCNLCHHLNPDSCSLQRLPGHSAELKDVYNRGQTSSTKMVQVDFQDVGFYFVRPYDLVTDTNTTVFTNYLAEMGQDTSESNITPNGQLLRNSIFSFQNETLLGLARSGMAHLHDDIHVHSFPIQQRIWKLYKWSSLIHDVSNRKAMTSMRTSTLSLPRQATFIEVGTGITSLALRSESEMQWKGWCVGVLASVLRPSMLLRRRTIEGSCTHMGNVELSMIKEMFKERDQIMNMMTLWDCPRCVDVLVIPLSLLVKDLWPFSEYKPKNIFALGPTNATCRYSVCKDEIGFDVDSQSIPSLVKRLEGYGYSLETHSVADSCADISASNNEKEHEKSLFHFVYTKNQSVS